MGDMSKSISAVQQGQSPMAPLPSTDAPFGQWACGDDQFVNGLSPVQPRSAFYR